MSEKNDPIADILTNIGSGLTSAINNETNKTQQPILNKNQQPILSKIDKRDINALIGLSDSEQKLSVVLKELNKPKHMDLLVNFAAEMLKKAEYSEQQKSYFEERMYEKLKLELPSELSPLSVKDVYTILNNQLEDSYLPKDKLVAQIISKAGLPNGALPEDANNLLKDHAPYIDALRITEATPKKLQCIQKLIKNDLNGYHIDLAGDIIEKAPPEQKFTLLVSFAEAAPNTKHSQKAFEKLSELIGNDSNLHAEVILAATSGKNLTPAQKKQYDKFYDEKVRFNEQDGKTAQTTELKDFDKMMKEMSPRDFGRLLFQEGKIKDAHHPELKNKHLDAFKESAIALRNNINGNEKNVLTKGQLDAAVGSLRTNLTREQMAFVVESVKQFDDFNKKNYFSKLLTRFVDAICRTKIDNKNIAAGIKDLVTKGADIKTEKTNKPEKSNNVAPPPSKTRGGGRSV